MAAHTEPLQRQDSPTKLSGKATPFWPSVDNTSASTNSLSASSFSEVDSSTGSVDRVSWSSWAAGPPGHWDIPVSYPPPLPPGILGHSQSQSGGYSSGNGPATGFKLGDFSSKLLKRAQTTTTQEPNLHKGIVANFTNMWNDELHFAQALMADTLATAPCNATVKGTSSDRRQAMQRCMQPLEPLEKTIADLECKSAIAKGGQTQAGSPLQHAATFDEADSAKLSSGDSSREALPVRRTFIHFKPSDVGNGPMEPLSQWSSSPAIILSTEFHTKFPAMEAAHHRGDCRPCVYYTSKTDGCRQGENCAFCHLCPLGAHQKKRKERVLAIRKQEALAKQQEHAN